METIDEKKCLREALHPDHSSDRFETDLSKVVRKYGGTYQDYIALIGKVRVLARKDGLTLRKAAERLT